MPRAGEEARSAPGWHNGMRGSKGGQVSPAARGILTRWSRKTVRGLYRCAVLTGLTGVIPAVGAAVAVLGSMVSLSWSHKLIAPLIVQALATLGELGVALLWTAVAVRLALILAGRPLSQAARLRAGSWLGMRIEPRYRPVPAVTRMASGWWWNGYDYHQSQREARRRAWMLSRLRDPQAIWDATWFLAATVTVLPAAALPLLGLAGGVYLALLPGYAGYGVVISLAGLAAAPFG